MYSSASYITRWENVANLYLMFYWIPTPLRFKFQLISWLLLKNKKNLNKKTKEKKILINVFKAEIPLVQVHFCQQLFLSFWVPRLFSSNRLRLNDMPQKPDSKNSQNKRTTQQQLKTQETIDLVCQSDSPNQRFVLHFHH